MLMTITITILATLFFATPFAKNPLSLLLLVILISLTIAVMFSIALSSWYSFLIFLIYVSGMLVMFAYFAATTPNQLMSIKSTLRNVVLIAIPMFSYTAYNTVTYPVFKPSDFQISMLYEYKNLFILIGVTLILLFAMIVIVKLTEHSKGPMRPFK